MNRMIVVCAALCFSLGPLGCYEARLVRTTVPHGLPDTPHDLTVTRDGKPLPVEASMKFEGGDHVRTGPNTGAVLRFVNGAELVLGPATEVEVLDPAVWAFMGELWIWGVLTVNSEYGVAVTEGTVFHVTVDPESPERSRLTVLEGTVSLTPAGSSERLRVGALESVEIAQPRRSPRRISPADRDGMLGDANRILVTPWTQVPDVRGMSYREAREALRRMGFESKRETVVAPNTPVGTVLRQSPEPDHFLRQGKTVTLYVAAEESVCTAPDILARGWTTLAAVERGFRAAGFRSVTAFFDPQLASMQTPKAGETRPCDLALRVGVQSHCTVPDVGTLGSRLSPNTVRRLFEHSGFTNLREIRIATPQTAQSPRAGIQQPCHEPFDAVVPRGGGAAAGPG